jgi:hypothetical protein
LRRFEKIRSLRERRLWGYRLESRGARGRYGFFVGFLLSSGRAPNPSLAPEFPQCAVIAYVRPPSSALHRRMVRAEGSVFRRAYELLTKYTNRRPRFEFNEANWQALARRVPLAAFPAGEEEKYSRNFFMETLALVVRSGLPEKLTGQPAGKQVPRSRSR